MKFIGTKREFGKVIIESEATLQNPVMVALFMLMKGALGDPDYVPGVPRRVDG